jgi:hypothetical protein
MDDAKLRHIARTQEGLFTREQAMSCGFSSWQVTRRIANGTWTRIVGSVLTSSNAPLTGSARDRAVLLATPGGVLAGPAAARRWDIPVPDPRPCVAVGRNRQTKLGGGIHVIRDDIEQADLTIFEGLPITSIERTVFDCVRLLPDEAALDVLDVALRRRLITFEDFCARVRGYVGRPGVPRLVGIVRQVGSGARSHAERLLVRLLRDSGIYDWSANAEIYDDAGLIGLGDVVFEQARVVLEVDGWEFHSARSAFERDRTRQNRLVGAGWTVLRFTWRDLVRDPDRVVNTIRVVLSRAERRRTTVLSTRQRS